MNDTLTPRPLRRPALLAALLGAGLLVACGGGGVDAPDAVAMAEQQRAEAAALDRAVTLARATTLAKVRGERTTASAAPGGN